MKTDKLHTLAVMTATGVIPVYYDPSVERCISVVKACYEGGVKVFEFTNRGDYANEVFVHLHKWVAENLPDMILGAGSVADAPTAVMFLQAGARFVVGPLFNAEIAKVCNRRNVPYIPGCGTVTEVGTALEAGCDVIKVFPGEVLTPMFVKAVLGPMPWTKLMVTGGVDPTPESISKWIGSGAVCVGMGSKLFPKSAVEQQDWQRISTLCRGAIEAVRETRERES